MHRLLVVPSKKLPSGDQRQPHWAFVDGVGDSVDDIKAIVGEFHYHTKTRGERTGHACRIVGEAIYEIAKDSQHSYLFYELELPKDPDEAQAAFNIQKEAVILCQVKNPHAASVTREGAPAPGLAPSQRPTYPARLQAHFAGKRVAETKFASLEPEMLNYRFTELLLLGVKRTAAAVLGQAEVSELEHLAELEEAEVSSDAQAEHKLSEETGVSTPPALHRLN